MNQSDFLSSAAVENLKRRAMLLRQTRAFFDDRGFIEVQTPTLCRDTVIDRHLDPIEVPVRLPGDEASTWYLQTSPEQSMKRLLNSGIGSIYQIGPVFRDGELGQFHNPEFTMLEWYDVDASFANGLKLLDELLRHLLGTTPCEQLRFEEAFRLSTGLSIFDCKSSDFGVWSVKKGLVGRVDWSNDWDDWVNLIFSECVQPTLGFGAPVLVTHFPASQAALAKVCSSDTRTAERYEAFYQGVELANGYHELLDAEQLLDRSIQANRQRELDGKKALPTQNRLLEAMRSGMPNSCGCALGFDRVVMLACGAKSLEEVVTFTARNA